MRISSASLYRHASQDVMKYQREMSDLQSQISSGKKLQKPSDNPVDAAHRVDIRESLSQVDQYIRNIGFAETSLTNEEKHLANSEDILLRVRELALISNNATTSETDYPSIKVELEQLRNNLLAQANAKDADGNYIFAGSRTATKPITPGGLSLYSGDDESRQIQVNQNLRIQASDSGEDIFLRIFQSDHSHTVSANPANTGSSTAAISKSGTGAAPATSEYAIRFTSINSYDIVNLATGTNEVSGAALGISKTIDFAGLQITFTGDPNTNDEFLLNPTQQQDVFTTLDEFINLVESAPGSSAEKALQRQHFNAVLLNIDQAFEHLTLKRADVGSRLASLDIVKKENEASEYQLTSMLSKIEDVDYADAISALQQRAVALEALQKTIQQSQGLSLFNY